ncbi:sensor histidine kinase [Pontibacter lucknowensis]|uniref:histidine kinase n=1 Tax=Pontibacter lucknowensis TaxID=1077936 RepID=A0A1N6UWI2_9BACT|nr:sensor histidine kinase [Pontibacter lucknowensis]SIQ69993.1 Signal transduction histidine kinase [Pontibacter lucknowensis]
MHLLRYTCCLLHLLKVLALLLFLSVALHVRAQAPNTVDVTASEQIVADALQVYHDPGASLNVDQVQSRSFAANNPDAVLEPGKTVHWVRVVLRNPTNRELTRLLYAGDWSHLELYQQSETGYTLKRTGQLLPIGERDVPSYKPYVLLELLPNSTTTLYLRLQGDINLYKPQVLRVQLLLPEQVSAANSDRLFGQGIFIGIILVMTLYNLVLFASVRDRSYLYYVLALLGTGLYFMFYHGFAIELLWPNAPLWNAHSFPFIVTFNGLFRVLFTRHYLNTQRTMPLWDKALTLLALLYILPVGMGLLSYLTPLDLLQACVSLIGIIGGLVLVAMVLTSIQSLRQGYRPALYFLIANIFFVVGALLFILKENHLVPDTIVTVYAAQVGMVAQVVLFSLGLAYRLNTVTSELNAKVLEKERLEREKETERKLLIEQQKNELEVTVANRTAALRHRTQELKDTVRKLKASEHKLRRLNYFKDRFFSIISHDIRTPLATLESFLNILVNFSDKMKPDQMQKLATHTQVSVRNLQALLENLLQWSTAQTVSGHHVRFEPEVLAVEELVNRNVTLLKDTANTKQISWQVEVPTALQVRADAHMLDFVIRNLLHNAIKFSYPSGLIQVTAAEGPGNMVTIAVTDQGTGISPDVLATLFKLETPAKATKGTINEKGTGLGLLLCRDFVERHGGKIQVETELGQGSRFYFTVPLVIPEQSTGRQLQLEGEIC